MKRNAFTLIELLVVITIIGILIGTIGVVYSVVARKPDEVKVAMEIGALDNSLKAFNVKYGFFPPSSFTLGPWTSMNTSSKAYMARMYPFLDKNALNGLPTETLGGDQCLVFFLGGFQGKGWSPNPKSPFYNPADPNLAYTSFFSFDNNRLSVIPGNTSPSYKDPFGNYYGYFCKEGNTAAWRTTDCNKVKDAKGASPVPYFNALPPSMITSETIKSSPPAKTSSSAREVRTA